jgi:hypothetical protein
MRMKLRYTLRQNPGEIGLAGDSIYLLQGEEPILTVEQVACRAARKRPFCKKC